MKLFYSIIISLLSVAGYSQTILHQTESTTRTVQDPQTVIMAPGFRATSGISNPFVAKIGPGTENPGGGPSDSGAGAGNPSGTNAPANQSFHDTKGNIEVTKAGQLQYTLAIDIPPGVKNIAPNISLVYTSGGQNGLAGYNWNITGLNSISRIGKNLEVDGITKGVQLDYSDYYSFNGQRLILKSGEYGKDGAEYVTEKYSNIKIKSIGNVSGVTWQGPEYWEVTFDDGSQAWYGSASPGNSSARTPIDYNIVKSKDINGNLIIYNYILENNIAIISSIEWGGNEMQGTPHFNKIEFVFGVRPLPETAYIKGIGFSQSKLLESIIVTSNHQQYKKYRVTYKKDLQETAYRYLDKITVFNSQNEEANPVIFTYEKSMDIPNPNIQTWGFPNVVNHNYATDLFGDFDGDGRLDFMKYHTSTSANIPQIGIYFYRNFYHVAGGGSPPVYVGNSITQAEFKNAIAVNLKRNNLVNNRQGFVTWKYINPSGLKYDLELSFYGITENNQIVLYNKKTIPGVNYDYSVGTTQEGVRTTISGLYNVDFNGDGLSELVLTLNDKTCWRTDINGTEKLPHQCENIKRYIVIDPDESIQNNQWFYELLLYTDTDNAFVDYKSGDFNGDGVFDLVKIDQNKKPFIITFQKNSQGKYISSTAPFNPTNNTLLKGIWKDGLAGDYNGDGLSDIMIPESNDSDLWYLYMSTGIDFKEETRVFMRQHKSRTVTKDNYENITVANPRTFVAFDINNDGKTELIFLQSSRYYQKEYNQDNPSAGVKYRVTSGSGVSVLATFGGGSNPLYSDQTYGQIVYLNSSNINSFLAPNAADKIGIPVGHSAGAMLKKFALVSIVPNFEGDLDMDTHKYYDISMEGRIKSISQGNITTDIVYNRLDKTPTPNLYNNTSEVTNYPYVEIGQVAGMHVVSQLIQNIAADKKLKQDFRYRGLTSNILGRGMIGFRKTARSSWYADGFENTKIWSGVEIDPINEGIPIKEWSIRTNMESQIFPVDVSENNAQLLSFKSTTYQTDKLLNGQLVTTFADADKPKVVTAIIPKISKSKDFLSGILTTDNITYGDYYLPLQRISNVNSGYAISTSTFEYTHNPTGIGVNYFIGRPKSKTDIAQAYGDTKSAKEENTYENNQLKTLKIWNRDNTGYLLETYSYDGFGNLTQKTISNSIDPQTQTIKTNYDDKGRFILKKTDNLGLETNTTYNNWGQILTQTNALGNVLTNTYDNWGKLLKSKINLGGTTTYQYDRDSNSNIIITQYNPDGDISKNYTNKLGQNYKTSTKAFGQGQFVSKDTRYDILGRKIRESELYFEGQSPSQWNVLTYDDTVFPTKVTSTALAKINASDEITSFTGKRLITTASGLTTTIKEDNGYERTNSKTTDALGNVLSSNDKGGTIQFTFNAAGEQIKAQYAENIVTTKYDAWGRKSEFNDPSNGLYKYEYDGFGQPKKIISPKGTKEYAYNNLGQLITQKELSTNDSGQASNKTITYSYDDKGRVISKSGTSKGKAYSSNVSYDPQGRVLSSSESSNGKYFIQKGITYDDKARVISYEKQLYSSGILTKVQIENVYSTWNGELYQIKNSLTGTVLWELKETNARGQVSKVKLGAADVNNMYDENGFLTNVNHSSQVKTDILQIHYSFDGIKNELRLRTTGGDFSINETFDYDDNNRLINWTNPVTGVKVQNAKLNVYDAKGRILENDQVGKIKFENSSKIYQPTGMTLNAAGEQNYNNDLIQSVVYNENNDPVFIDGEKGDVAFQYGLTAMRQRVTYGGNFSEDGDGKFTKFYSSDGSFEVVKDNTTGKEKHILYIGGTPYESNILYLKNYDESTGSHKFLHKDYIGSILAISDEAGNKLEQRHFDAWGNFTHFKIGNGAIITDKSLIANSLLLIERGYTSHEHFAEVGIIHMNGRLYDPLLRRFLNADENIQDPYNTQNYNKYGYVMNNPMMYSDPNGEFWWWAVGAIAGGYLSGVQANNGNWNPRKWNWESTWSAVLGGAIGGAAVSGALGNISSYAGAIKSFLPGIVSGGLNSAFTGSNFLTGAIGGISYSANVFDNKITSTDYFSVHESEVIDEFGEKALTQNEVIEAFQQWKGPYLSYGFKQNVYLAPLGSIPGNYTLNESGTAFVRKGGGEAGAATVTAYNPVIGGKAVRSTIYIPPNVYSTAQVHSYFFHEFGHSVINHKYGYKNEWNEKIETSSIEMGTKAHHAIQQSQNSFIIMNNYRKLNLQGIYGGSYLGIFAPERVLVDLLKNLIIKVK
ncbi:RHS repeat-associated core domain-containing protein [Chryseobacterium balustinum]|nr:RHS repeat-associated core domain-containing protein [Chryseobacterium balustinum]